MKSCHGRFELKPHQVDGVLLSLTPVAMSMSGEENDNSLVEDSLRAKLLEVGQLRKDIEDLRTAISDRYAQDMGENCVTQ